MSAVPSSLQPRMPVFLLLWGLKDGCDTASTVASAKSDVIEIEPSIRTAFSYVHAPALFVHPSFNLLC